ncbi:MAG: DUF1579 domain-containing protein [Ignavibacteria bacterium]|nr:DUF1579 domain-containing protein [Ignavibacteria bacterium]
MKKLVYLFVLLFLISSFSFVKAQDQDAMKKWMDYMTPGEQQKQLAKMSGDWTYTSKFWMAPGQDPTVSNGTAKFETLLDGRYMKCTVKGNMMGMPFEGMSITGFDNAAKLFQSSWIDNMGTGIMHMTGTADAKGVITLKGGMMDPVSGKMLDEKQVMWSDGDNKFVMEMYQMENGAENKVMEVVYTR